MRDREYDMKCCKYESRNEEKKKKKTKEKKNKNELDYFIYYFCSLPDS